MEKNDKSSLNMDRLDQLATWLENGAEHSTTIQFNMALGLARKRLDLSEPYNPKNPEHNSCSTSCCIAGAAVQFFDDPEKQFRSLFTQKIDARMAYLAGRSVHLTWDSVMTKARRLLGLSQTQAYALFNPDEAPMPLPNISLDFFNSPKWAARTIRHLMKTGHVNWHATADATKKAVLKKAGYRGT